MPQQQLPEGVTIVDSSSRMRPGGCALWRWPVLPALAGFGAVVSTGVWFHCSTLALQDTKVIAALIGLPPPRAFASVLPSLMAASLALVIATALAAWAAYAWRTLQQRRSRTSAAPRGFAGASAAALALTLLTTVWCVFMLALSMLWLGGGLVASKATADGAGTLAVVDETMPRLIKTAMGIDPAEAGYLVHVNGRDINIGTSSCSLFCFTLARAMLADSVDCTCDEALAARLMPQGNVTAGIPDQLTCSQAPVMCAVNSYAYSLYRDHMMPAVGAMTAAVLLLLALLMLLSGTAARASGARDAVSRCSSADADVRFGGGSGSDGDSPRKGDA